MTQSGFGAGFIHHSVTAPQAGFQCHSAPRLGRTRAIDSDEAVPKGRHRTAEGQHTTPQGRAYAGHIGGSPQRASGPRVQAEKRSSDQRQRPPSLLQAAVTAEDTAHSVEQSQARWPGKAAACAQGSPRREESVRGLVRVVRSAARARRAGRAAGTWCTTGLAGGPVVVVSCRCGVLI
jgi:hypothetical protein